MQSPLLRFLHDKLKLVVFLTLFATLIAFLAPFHWTLELSSHFRLQYFGACVLWLILMLLLSDRRWSVIALAGVLINGAFLVPWYVGRPGEPPAGGTPFRAILANVYTDNLRSAPLLDWILEEAPDLVVLQETDDRWLGELAPLSKALPHSHTIARRDNFGIGVWSKTPFLRTAVLHEGEDIVAPTPGAEGSLPAEVAAAFETPTIHVTIEVNGRRLAILATHPVPPGSAGNSASRNAQLTAIAAVAQSSADPMILLGDLNVTMFSPVYRGFAKDSGLRNTRQGFGVVPTWPTNMVVMQIPLDHCLVSPEIHVRDFRRGPTIWSDHYPIVVDLMIPAAK